MPRQSVTLTKAFKEAVATYQKWRGLESWSQALLELAAIGYQRVMRIDPPAFARTWGGDRKSPEFVESALIDLERAEVEALGLPPLDDE